MPSPETSPTRIPGGPNTLIKQGAKLVATWEDVWEEPPQDVRLALTPPASAESQAGQTASLFEEPSLSPHEKKIYSVLKADEAMHLDEIIEKLELARHPPKSSPHFLSWSWLER